MTPDEIKGEVKKAYAQVAQPTQSSCCDSAESSCCGPSDSSRVALLEKLGYDGEVVVQLPESVTESYAGCGNPVALASLQEGEVVLDLGSGAGLDMFVASEKVGQSGRVIGVDMTPEMVEKARENAAKLGRTNVEIRLGDIEDMPVDDESVDVIISNCVINLAPNKAKVFTESFRVLRPGGRMMISDLMLEEPLPEDLQNEIAAYTGCIAGAVSIDEYEHLMREAGFTSIEVVEKVITPYRSVVSVNIAAFKPSK